MSKDTQIPVGEFMKIRDAVADELRKGASSQTQRTTLVRQAEGLILAGFVDIEVVRESVAPSAEALPDSVIEHARAGKVVAAIAELRSVRNIGLREAKDIVDRYRESIVEGQS